MSVPVSVWSHANNQTRVGKLGKDAGRGILPLPVFSASLDEVRVLQARAETSLRDLDRDFEQGVRSSAPTISA